MTCAFVEDLGMLYPRDDSPRKYRFFLVICPHCNKEFKTQARFYKKGTLASCRKCSSGIRDKSIYHRKHGLSDSPLYAVWAGIKDRCNNKNNIGYVNYGGRGISVCQEWSGDFKKFHDWSMSQGYMKGLDIDRIDNNGDYKPSNCRYVSRFVNMSNTRHFRKTNTTGFRGVFRYGKTKRFYSKIQMNGSQINLGVSDTAEQASKVYEHARKIKYQNL